MIEYNMMNGVKPFIDEYDLEFLDEIVQNTSHVGERRPFVSGIFNNDGTIMYKATWDSIITLPLPAPYSISKIDAELISVNPLEYGGVGEMLGKGFFNADGSRYFFASGGGDNPTITEFRTINGAYDLSELFKETKHVIDVSSVWKGPDTKFESITVSNSGLYVFCIINRVAFDNPIRATIRLELAQAYDFTSFNCRIESINTSIYEGNGFFMEDYFFRRSGEDLYRIKLATSDDINSSEYVDQVIYSSFTDEDMSLDNMTPDGLNLFGITELTTLRIHPLTQAFDILSINYNTIFSINLNSGVNYESVRISNDGSRIYCLDTSDGTVYMYRITTPNDLSTVEVDSYHSFILDSPSEVIKDFYFAGANQEYIYTIQNNGDINTYSNDLSEGFPNNPSREPTNKDKIGAVSSEVTNSCFNVLGNQIVGVIPLKLVSGHEENGNMIYHNFSQGDPNSISGADNVLVSKLSTISSVSDDGNWLLDTKGNSINLSTSNDLRGEGLFNVSIIDTLCGEDLHNIHSFIDGGNKIYVGEEEGYMNLCNERIYSLSTTNNIGGNSSLSYQEIFNLQINNPRYIKIRQSSTYRKYFAYSPDRWFHSFYMNNQGVIYYLKYHNTNRNADIPIQDICMTAEDDKALIYEKNGELSIYSLASKNEVSDLTWSLESRITIENLEDIFISNDGAYFISNDGGELKTYTLSTRWDLSSMNLMSAYSLGVDERISISNDGGYLYVTSLGGTSIKKYTFVLPYDVSTLTYHGELEYDGTPNTKTYSQPAISYDNSQIIYVEDVQLKLRTLKEK